MSRRGVPPGSTSPFTTEQASQSGISRRDLYGSAYRPILRGVHVGADALITARLEASAVLEVAPESVIARHTAAELWGGVVPHSPDIHVAVPQRLGLTRAGVRASRHRQLPEHRLLQGIPVTTPERTFLDLAAWLDLVDLVVLGDSLVRRGVTDIAALTAAARGHRGRGAKMARRAVDYVRADVDSPMETRLRLLLVLAGLPEPIVNHVVRDEFGAWIYRFDLSFPDLKLAIEYDGRQHAESTHQWTSDVARRETLDTWGWRLLIVLSRDIYSDPAGLLHRVCAAMAERGRRVRVTDPTWQRHFPQRRSA